VSFLSLLMVAGAETTETIVLTLSNPGGGYTLGSPGASINLIDNDIATVSFTGNYTQDFNTLAASGTSGTLPSGWLFAETATNANTTYTAGDGSSNTGDTYSFGTGTATGGFPDCTNAHRLNLGLRFIW